MPSVNDVGPGWADIVISLIEEVDKHGGKVHQIKEKFGGLRFYYQLPKDTTEEVVEHVRELVRTAESISDQTCEECGAPGYKTNGGWIKTLCNFHDKERQREMKEQEDEIAKRYGKREQEGQV